MIIDPKDLPTLPQGRYYLEVGSRDPGKEEGEQIIIPAIGIHYCNTNKKLYIPLPKSALAFESHQGKEGKIVLFRTSE